MTELENQELESIIDAYKDWNKNRNWDKVDNKDYSLWGPESNIRDSIWYLLDWYNSNHFSSEVPVCFEYADNLVKYIKSNVKLKYLTVEVNTTVHFPMVHGNIVIKNLKGEKLKKLDPWYKFPDKPANPPDERDGAPDGNGEPTVPHLDDPPKKTPYNPDDDPDIPHLKDPPKKRPYNPFVDGLLDGLKGLFGTAGQDPIVLDLDGDGVETLGQDAGVFFDHDANGFAQLSGWVAPDDGLLVWDRNGNGQIDDGSELFGNNSLLENGQKAANGFAALAELDKNGDGVLDANDAAFAALRVWRDKNSDGQVGEGELLTLDELGIQSLGTNYTVQQVVDANGNALRQQGSFTYVNGSTGQMGDVWFTEDTARSLPTERVEVPEEIAALPDVMAFGNVYSLHQAMARDESGALRTLVEEFAWADGYLTVGLPAAA